MRPNPPARGPRRPPPKRRKAPLWTKLLIIVGALVTVVSTATVAVPKLLIRWATGNIVQHFDVPDELKANNIDGPINFLLLGTDSGASGGAAGDKSHTGLNTDSIVLVHIPATHDQVYMISIPRDTYVGIPSRRSAATDCTAAAHDKINAAFAFGAYDANGHQSASDQTARGNGIVLTMRTINCLVGGGLKFNGSALVNFDGFDKIVAAIGSVYMCIDENVWSVHYNADGTPNDWTGSNPAAERYSPANRSKRKHYTKGDCRDFQPWEALDYARQRDDLELGDSDYGRQRHQQQLLKAIMKKVASPNTLANLQTITKLRDAAGGALTLSLNDTPIEDFVLTLSSLRADDIVTIKTYAAKFNSIPCDIGGMTLSCEGFGDDLRTLLQDARDDKVFDFLAAHPDWLDQDNNPGPVTPTVSATK